MQLAELFDIWAKDSAIDKTELGDASLNGPKLHQKYYVLYSKERSEYRKMESVFKQFRLRKVEFYMNGPDEETRALGWQLPPKGKVLKGEVDKYVDADPDVVSAALELAHQLDKVQFLESVLKTVAYWNKTVQNAIDWTRFTAGG